MWPTLANLAASRKSLQSEWLVVPNLSDMKKAANQDGAQPERVDLDDLHTLDKAMRREPRLEQAWLHFRKTFVVERTAWFIEPKVFATRTAAEFFPRDLLNSRLNLAFYHQFPSLITGVGLLFTFLAILIGLEQAACRWLSYRRYSGPDQWIGRKVPDVHRGLTLCQRVCVA